MPTVTVAIGAGSLALPPGSRAADKRTDLDCSALFKQLNTGNRGKMMSPQAAADPISERAFNGPAINEKGYLTDSAFKHAYVGTVQLPDCGQKRASPRRCRRATQTSFDRRRLPPAIGVGER